MCLVDEGAIFLDISANAYLGIDTATKDALTTRLAGLDAIQGANDSRLTSHPPDGVAELMRRGLITDSKAIGRPFSPLTVSSTHAVPFGIGRKPAIRIGLIPLARFVAALTCASIMIRRGHLLPLITRLMTLKDRLSTADRTDEWKDVATVVHTFRRLSTFFYTSKNACLLDSLLLTEFLIGYGHRPTLILGVRTKPFLPHAWVQVGGCVLNDSLEHAQTLTPIAAF